MSDRDRRIQKHPPLPVKREQVGAASPLTKDIDNRRRLDLHICKLGVADENRRCRLIELYQLARV